MPQIRSVRRCRRQPEEVLEGVESAVVIDLGELRTRFGAPEALLGWLAGQTGIAPDATPRSAGQLVEHFSWDVIRTHRENITVTVE